MSNKLESMPDDWRRALAIVAHPDDMEFGAAAAVSVWAAAGRQVAYLLVTRGEAGIAGMPPEQAARVREQEQRSSAALVGVDTVEFLDHRDGAIEEGLPLRRDLARAIRRHRPELVVTLNHHDWWSGRRWNSADHRAVGRAVLDAVGDAGNQWIFPELVREGFEPWDGVRWIAIAGSPEPTHAIDVTAHLETAVRSLAAHHAYLSALGDEPPEQMAATFLHGITSATAQRFSGSHAVAFELVTR